MNSEYQGMYFDVFSDNIHQESEYVITMENDHKNLVIITQDNSHLYYQNLSYMSVNDQQKQNLTLYPNPTKDFLYIENLTENVQLGIYDLSGRKLLDKELSNSAESINISHLSEGMYFYEIHQNGKAVKSGKLIKK